jgi:hypothetical protein
MKKHGLFETAETLQQLLISEATGGHEENADYGELRQALVADPTVAAIVPRFLRTCRSTGQFWQFIKAKYGTYAERRAYIWEEFGPLMDYLERGSGGPADPIVTVALEKYDAEHVRAAWAKAIERRSSDPEGAITSARTLIESICKHILDESGKTYDDKDDLPKLYRQTAQLINLAPSQHTEEVFKQILGGCTAVVEGLGTLRNRLSDAHGKGKVASRPLPRHAELAVNLSGALAMYLLSTWDAREKR